MADYILSASKEETQREVAQHFNRLELQRLRTIADCEKNALKGYTQGWHVTINSKFVVSDHDDKIRYTYKREQDHFQSQLSCFANRLQYFCYPHAKNKRLQIVSVCEIGTRKRLHAHLIVVHDGSVRKTTDQIKNEVIKQWGKVYEFAPTGFVEVKPIYYIRGLVEYVTCKREEMFCRFGQETLFTH